MQYRIQLISLFQLKIYATTLHRPLYKEFILIKHL